MDTGFQIAVAQNEEIRPRIAAFLRAKGWKNAYISGAIGSVTDMKYIVPVQWPAKLEVITCALPAELLSFTGELLPLAGVPPALKAMYADELRTSTEDYLIHIHASAAVAGAHVYGGGFLSGRALRGVTVFIQPAFPLFAE
jgi:predicted DNA-binding protein with PD1-like motif